MKAPVVYPHSTDGKTDDRERLGSANTGSRTQARPIVFETVLTPDWGEAWMGIILGSCFWEVGIESSRTLTLETGEVGGQVGGGDLLLQYVGLVEEEDDRCVSEPGQLQDRAEQGQTLLHSVLGWGAEAAHGSGRPAWPNRSPPSPTWGGV